MPVFSIVIPTRARADTLQYTLKTALNQTFTDIEVIVHESGADPATAKVLAEISDPRLRFYNTGEPVSMPDNWERALDHVRGDYVIFVGDDDGLLPDSCMIAKHFFDHGIVDVLTSLRAVYWWRGYNVPTRRNHLWAQYGKTLKFTIKDSRAHLAAIFRFEQLFIHLPMIYYSFVSRRLIDHIRSSRGRYFFGASPDINSGIFNCHFTQSFALCNRPIALGGVSHHSTAFRMTTGDAAARDDAIKAALREVNTHPTMANGASFSITLSLANEYLLAKDELFPFQPPELDYAAVLSHATRDVARLAPRWRDAIREEIRWIAAKNNVPAESILIPAQGSQPNPVRDGHENADTVVVDVDGDAVGVSNVFEASLYFENILPPLERSAQPIIEFPKTS